MDLTELNQSYESRHCELVLDLINYIVGGAYGSCRLSAVSGLRDGVHLIKVISTYERQTRWQSSHVIDLFFKYKNDTINCYSFINGWLDTYYHTCQVCVGDGLRYASDQQVMTIAILVLNVLYSRRQSLTNDLKLRLEAVWIDLNSIADWIVLSIRTRAQQIPTDTTLHSCAHQLFSGHSLFEYQAIQQRLTLMVQQKLINEQNKKLEEQELVMKKHAKDYSDLGTKLCAILIEVNELRRSHLTLADELKWQKGINKELNDNIDALKNENSHLKLKLKLFAKKSFEDNAYHSIDGGIDGGIDRQSANSAKNSSDNADDEPLPNLTEDNTYDKLETSGESRDNQKSYSHFAGISHLDSMDDVVSAFLSNDSQLNDISGLHIDCNIVTHKDSHSSNEDMTDSGNHSDAADDLLIDINQCCQSKEMESSTENDKEDNDQAFSFSSWKEFFAHEGNCEHDDHHNDTYNKSNQSLGTNNINRKCINNFI